jgi:hypothetical protein
MKIRIVTILALLLIAAAPSGGSYEARAETAAAGATNYKGLDEEVQSLQQEILEVSRDLFMLEEELLFPATTQVSVFLSMDVGEFFQLDSVQLKIGDKEVANYLYTQREVDALKRGGVQRIYVGNLKLGEHELVAFFTGKGPNERDYRRGANLTFKKGIGPKYIELKIVDLEKKQQPEFSINEWE